MTYQGELIDRHALANGDRIYLAPKVVLMYQEESRPVAVPSRPAGYGAPALKMQPAPASAAIVPSPSPREQIVIEVDGRVAMIRLLDKETLMVGRLPGNDLQISSPLISGQHAMLMRQDGKWIIIDRRSRNGLTYEGKRVERHTLNKGDCIYLAPTVMLRLE